MITIQEVFYIEFNFTVDIVEKKLQQFQEKLQDGWSVKRCDSVSVAGYDQKDGTLVYIIEKLFDNKEQYRNKIESIDTIKDDNKKETHELNSNGALIPKI